MHQDFVVTTKHQPASSSTGFTLIELMITISVFAILAAMAVPMLGQMIASYRVRSATDELYSSLIYARSEAIKRNQFVAVCAKTADGNGCEGSTDWSLGWIVFVDDDGDGTPSAVSDIFKRQDSIANVTITGTGGNASFQRDGRLRAAVASYVSSSPSYSGIKARCLGLGLSGMPSVKVDSDSNPGNGC